MKSTRCQ